MQKIRWPFNSQGRRSILIIDDEQEIVSLLSRVLEKQDFQVFSAGSLDEGWKHLRRVYPAILFLDINLPDGNGLQALENIRKSFPQTQVIMISAYDTSDDRKKAQVHGAHSFLSKPFSLSQVISLVEEIGHSPA